MPPFAHLQDLVAGIACIASDLNLESQTVANDVLAFRPGPRGNWCCRPPSSNDENRRYMRSQGDPPTQTMGAAPSAMGLLRCPHRDCDVSVEAIMAKMSDSSPRSLRYLIEFDAKCATGVLRSWRSRDSG